MSIIKLKDRSNIKVYNTCASRVCLKVISREYDFDAAVDGVYPMYPMSFMDIEYANSRNPEIFVTGMLTFEESERAEIYEALNHPDWRDRIWTDETIEDALIHPTKAKMERILAVRDVLTIERIRGIMTKVANSKTNKILDKVVELVNGRHAEIFAGKKRSQLSVALPESVLKDDAEKKALKADKENLENKLKEMEEKIALLMAMQSAAPAPTPEPEVKKPAGRPPKKT